MQVTKMALSNETEIMQCDDVRLLCEALGECQIRLADEVCKMALLVRRLDQLGAEISVENSILCWVRLIAHGQLSPSLFATWHCEPRLLEAARQLPLPIQDRIADNEPMKLMILGGDHRMVRPGDMNRDDIKQLFAGKRLRTDAEQIGWLHRKAEKDRAKSKPASTTPIAHDRRRKGIVVTGNELFISLAELIGHVSALTQ